MCLDLMIDIRSGKKEFEIKVSQKHVYLYHEQDD